VELDCVRPVGGNTGVSIWIDGKLRAIVVSAHLTDASLPAPISEDDRCWLVAANLRRIQRAAADYLLRTNPAAGGVFVDESIMLPLTVRHRPGRERVPELSGYKRRARG